MHHGFLSELIQEKMVVCPVCHHDKLALGSDQLLCRNCQTIWPVRNDVPDLYNRYKTSNNRKSACENIRKIDAAAVDLLINALDLHQDKYREAVRQIVHRTRALSSFDDAITAEIQDVTGRFLPRPDAGVDDIAADANTAPDILLERHYFPEQIPPAAKTSANIRVKNIGHHPWSSRTEVPLSLAVYWTKIQSKEVVLQSHPVRFPVDIAPGRCITMPMAVSTPPCTGIYALNVCLVSGSDRVAATAATPITMIVKSHSLREQIAAFFHIGKKPITPVMKKGVDQYDRDHETGRAVFEAELKKRRRSTRVLEIGSGVHPQTAWISDSKTVALDISAPLLELGSLYFTEKKLESQVAFICADGCDPPFKPNTFDAVAMFSTLHHFPEPEKVLGKTAELLKKDGFVAVMCEPVNDTLEALETIRELKKGINEQVFTWPEYVRIFDLAGLHTAYLQIDGGSLKAILTRE
jgi:SAM-dependent methyltransferase/uncharacterized protein YbaR (Trm112 family)